MDMQCIAMWGATCIQQQPSLHLPDTDVVTSAPKSRYISLYINAYLHASADTTLCEDSSGDSPSDGPEPAVRDLKTTDLVMTQCMCIHGGMISLEGAGRRLGEVPRVTAVTCMPRSSKRCAAGPGGP